MNPCFGSFLVGNLARFDSLQKLLEEHLPEFLHPSQILLRHQPLFCPSKNVAKDDSFDGTALFFCSFEAARLIRWYKIDGRPLFVSHDPFPDMPLYVYQYRPDFFCPLPLPSPCTVSPSLYHPKDEPDATDPKKETRTVKRKKQKKGKLSRVFVPLDPGNASQDTAGFQSLHIPRSKRPSRRFRSGWVTIEFQGKGKGIPSKFSPSWSVELFVVGQRCDTEYLVTQLLPLYRKRKAEQRRWAILFIERLKERVRLRRSQIQSAIRTREEEFRRQKERAHQVLQGWVEHVHLRRLRIQAFSQKTAENRRERLSRLVVQRWRDIARGNAVADCFAKIQRLRSVFEVLRNLVQQKKRREELKLQQREHSRVCQQQHKKALTFRRLRLLRNCFSHWRTCREKQLELFQKWQEEKKINRTCSVDETSFKKRSAKIKKRVKGGGGGGTRHGGNRSGKKRGKRRSDEKDPSKDDGGPQAEGGERGPGDRTQEKESVSDVLKHHFTAWRDWTRFLKGRIVAVEQEYQLHLQRKIFVAWQSGTTIVQKLHQNDMQQPVEGADRLERFLTETTVPLSIEEKEFQDDDRKRTRGTQKQRPREPASRPWESVGVHLQLLRSTKKEGNIDAVQEIAVAIFQFCYFCKITRSAVQHLRCRNRLGAEIRGFTQGNSHDKEEMDRFESISTDCLTLLKFFCTLRGDGSKTSDLEKCVSPDRWAGVCCRMFALLNATVLTTVAFENEYIDRIKPETSRSVLLPPGTAGEQRNEKAKSVSYLSVQMFIRQVLREKALAIMELFHKEIYQEAPKPSSSSLPTHPTLLSSSPSSSGPPVQQPLSFVEKEIFFAEFDKFQVMLLHLALESKFDSASWQDNAVYREQIMRFHVDSHIHHFFGAFNSRHEYNMELTLRNVSFYGHLNVPQQDPSE